MEQNLLFNEISNFLQRYRFNTAKHRRFYAKECLLKRFKVESFFLNPLIIEDDMFNQFRWTRNSKAFRKSQVHLRVYAPQKMKPPPSLKGRQLLIRETTERHLFEGSLARKKETPSFSCQSRSITHEAYTFLLHIRSCIYFLYIYFDGQCLRGQRDKIVGKDGQGLLRPLAFEAAVAVKRRSKYTSVSLITQQNNKRYQSHRMSETENK